ncbi:MAG: substrate-binding domain-containing protein [Chitinophagaceae bacterium]
MHYKKTYTQTIVLMLGTVLLCCLDSCKCNRHNEGKANNIDTTQTTPDKGTLYISVDETFRPVIDQQIQMYEATYPNAHIIADYKPEVECFKDFQKDETRLIIVARGLDSAEAYSYKTQLGAVPRFEVIAFDAVAVLVNKQAADSVFTYAQLQNLLTGETKGKSVVVDGSKATSTVRYLIDTLLRGKDFGVDVSATANTSGVLDAVANNANTVGFIGYSWFARIQDSANSYYDSKLKTALVECKTCPANMYARPSQENISNMRYPMFRPVVPIVKDRDASLATGFYNFIQSERGQLIFRRAALMPAVMSFNIRQVNLK